MSISIDWATKVISVPRSDLNLVQSSPSYVYNLSLNWLRIQLKDQEDNYDGILYPVTHIHNTEATLSGLTYARMLQIINGYTITFEDGQYAVNLTGANSNVADVTNVNQVSVRPQNSAGMTSSPAIEYGSFNNSVSLDVNSVYYGTVYPVGTPLQPVNNLSDALAIASQRGFGTIKVLSDITIPAGQDISSLKLVSDMWSVVVVEPGVMTTNTEFQKISLYGELSGSWNVMVDCWVYDVTNFLGWIRGGSIGRVELAPYVTPDPYSLGSSYFDDIVPMYADITSVVVFNTNASVSFTRCSDIVTIQGMTAGNSLVAAVVGGEVRVDNSCVAGTITVSGVGSYTNNSLLNVHDDGLSNAETVMSYERV
jgi:hypothetical protein